MITQENALKIIPLTIQDIDQILPLTQQLNPTVSLEELKARTEEIFQFDNYNCLGFYHEDKLVGLTGAWILVKLYSGKQLEIDHLIVDSRIQSKGFGRKFLALVQEWALEQGCNTMELNTYITNAASHKFYFNQGYTIKGYHFLKWLKKD